MITEETIYTLIKKYPLTWYEVDGQNILKPSALLNHLQDAATRSADKFGVGMEFLAPRNYAWFLIKNHLEFYDYPQNVDEILIKTESRGCSKIFALRDFEVWMSDESKCLMRSTTQWTMVNLEDKSFIKINTLDNIPSFEKRDDDLSFPKVNPQEKYDSHKTFEVRYDDIDINGHVNNANYVVWAFEALSHDFRKSHKLKTLDIIYKKDITYGNRVVSSLITENNKTYHILTNEQTNEQLCILDAEWVEL